MIKRLLPKKLNCAIVAVAVTAIAVLRISPASATGAVTVAPAYTRISISQAQPIQDTSIAVRNDFDVPITIAARLSMVDQSGGTLIPVEGDGDGFLQALSLSETLLTIEPKKSVNVIVRAINNDAISPGGHYAALIIQQSTESGQAVPLEQMLSVALFVVKEDGAIRDVTASVASPGGLVFSLPKSTNVVFGTKGNVDVVPKASVSVVKDTNTNIFAHGVANDSSVPLYPGKELTLRTDLQPTQRALWPGKYALLTRYRYEGQPSAQETAVGFWYVPIWFIGFALVLGVLTVIFAIIVRRHNLVSRLRVAIVQARRKKSVRVIPAVPIVHDAKDSVERRPKPVLDIAGPGRLPTVQKRKSERHDAQNAAPRKPRDSVKAVAVFEESSSQKERADDFKEPLDTAPEIKPKINAKVGEKPLENKSK